MFWGYHYFRKHPYNDTILLQMPTKKPPLSDFFQIESKLHPVPQTPGALLSLPAILLLLSGIIAFWNEMDMWHNWHVSKFVAIPKKNVESCSFSRENSRKVIWKKTVESQNEFLKPFFGMFFYAGQFLQWFLCCPPVPVEWSVPLLNRLSTRRKWIHSQSSRHVTCHAGAQTSFQHHAWGQTEWQKEMDMLTSCSFSTSEKLLPRIWSC